GLAVSLFPRRGTPQTARQGNRGTTMRRGFILGSVLLAASVFAATSAYGSLSTTLKTAAGKPTATSDLLCGLWSQGSDRISGQSDIDHPSGAMSMGQQYDYTGQNCESEYNGIGGFSNGSGMYNWTIGHSNVNTTTERGTEHGIFMLSADGGREAGFNGQITNYDFATPK